MVRAAVIYPLDSAPTYVTYIFGRKAAEILRAKGVEVDEFPILAANRLSWAFSRAFNGGYDFVVYGGHGLPKYLLGQAYLGPIPLGLLFPMQDVSMAPKVKIFYAVACLSGRELGPELVRKRTRSYVGSIDYVFVAYPKTEHDYMSDFVDTWLAFVRAIAQGETVSEAFRALKERMLYYIKLYEEKAKTWPHARFYAYALRRNYEGFRLYGDGSVRLF